MRFGILLRVFRTSQVSQTAGKDILANLLIAPYGSREQHAVSRRKAIRAAAAAAGRAAAAAAAASGEKPVKVPSRIPF